MNNKKIFVTGGAGYIGSNVCKFLAKKGFKIFVYDNLCRGNEWAVKWGEFIKGDILNEDLLKKTLKKINPKHVIHLAAYADIGESNKEPDKYYKNNIVGTINVLNAMKLNNIMHLSFSSSCSIFGNSKKKIRENCTILPTSPYAFSKYVCEKLIFDYSKRFDLKYLILRYFNAAGADLDNEIGEKNIFCKRIISEIIKTFFGQNKILSINGKNYDTKDGTCIRDYIHIVDVANAHFKGLLYLDEDQSNDFNIGSGCGTSIIELIKKVEKHFNKKINIVFKERRSGDADSLIASINKAKKQLKWQPKHSDINFIIKTAIKWQKKISISQ